MERTGRKRRTIFHRRAGPPLTKTLGGRKRASQMMKKAFGSPKKKREAASRTPGGKSRRVSPGRGSGPDKPDHWPLTPAQIREIDRRVADLDNPVRYLLV